MDTHTTNYINSDERLWKLARRRIEFKKHLSIYFIVNICLWVLWVFTGFKYGNNFIPWPAYVTFFWGIGVAFNFIGAYSGFKDTMVEQEYQKLKNKNA